MPRFLITTLIATFVLECALSPRAHGQVTRDDLQAAFRWFDGLGYPPIDKLPFIRVAGGVWYTDEKGKVTTHHPYGFLVGQHGDQFTVFFPDLTQKTYVQNHLPSPSQKRIGFDNVDIAAWARGWIAAHHADNGDARRDGFEGVLEEDAQIFILARACAGRRIDQLAFGLVGQSMARGGGRAGEGNWSYQKKLREHMAEASMWDTILRFDEPRASRSELLVAFRNISRRFGDSELGPRARETVDILDRMVLEDKEHATANPLSELSGKDRVSELIFQLRDQNGQQYMQPGECDIFEDRRGKDSPAQQLVDMGFAAIPQLIEVLEDRRFTRSITYGRNFFFSHHVLRVGDAARIIIERIAHREFDAGGSRRNAVVELGNAAAVKKQIAAWWQDYNVRGDERVLVEAVERGDRNSPTQAELLVKRHPTTALPAIASGLAHAREDWIAGNLVIEAAKLKGPAVTQLLHEQMKRGLGLYTRVHAAFALRQRGEPNVVQAMTDEWNRSAGRRDQDHEFDSLSGFLLSSNDPLAFRTMASGITKQPADVRLNILIGLMDGGFRYGFKHPDEAGAPVADSATQARIEQAVEDLLAIELLDTDERVGFGMGGSNPIDDPRLCDVAVLALHNLWSTRYAFKRGGSLFERDLQRLTAYNIWCRRSGKPGLPLPERPVPAGAAGINSVRSVDISATARQIAPEATRQLLVLKGRSLTSEVVMQALKAAGLALREGFTGLRFEAYRDNDGAGFAISLDILPGKLGKRDQYIGWNYTERVLREDESLYGVSGSGSWLDRSQVISEPDELGLAIRKALAAPKRQTVRISLQLTRTN